ncbi:MAG: heat-inducible transcription repressor HrcA [Caldisericia bacterium]|nr:heat-inducible transcription repressor HrcA [Caldisericia bacterium]
MREIKDRVLKDKKEAILFLTVKEYLDTGNPVGSKTLVEKYLLDVSPATVRNYMSEFEDEGYLTHIHTSSGRIPTEKGVKFYIDKIIERMNVMTNLKIEKDVQKSFSILGEDFIDLFLNKLSNLTNSISFFFYSVPKEDKIVNLHLMNCSYGKILFILASEEKVEEYVIKTNSEISDEELFEIKINLMKSIRENDESYLDKYRELYPDLISQIEKILNDRLKKREIGDIYFKGLKYILSYEDIKKSKDLETLITFVEEKEKALSLVDFLTEFKNLLILIGNEIENLTLEKTVLIDLPYLKEDNVEAGLGFITPNRFDFEYLFKILKQHALEIKEKLEKI